MDRDDKKSLLREIHDKGPAARDLFGMGIIFILALSLMLRQLVSTGYFTVIVEDAYIYPSWAWQFIESLKEGNVYPRWLPLDFWGYGSPTFLLYPPLAFYLTALFNLLTGSIVQAMNLVKFTALFITGAGTYFLVKEFHPPRTALLSAMFSVLLPFNIFSMYLYGSFAAMVSCIWFAPILLFAWRFCRTGRYRLLSYSGACYGGLILTHPITAYMFTFVIAAFSLYMAVVSKRVRDIAIAPAVLLTGLALSAAYTLPVIFERKYVNLGNFTTDINYKYSNFFLLPDMTAKIADWRFWPIYHDTVALHAALFCVFILICLARMPRPVEERNGIPTYQVNRFFLMTAVCSILLLFGISSFIWETVPFFRFIIFPSRWLHITAFSAAFLSASFFSGACDPRQTSKKRFILPALLFLTCLSLDLSFIKDAVRFNGNERPAMAVDWVLEHLPRGVRLGMLDKGDNVGDKAGFTLKGEGSARVVSWKSAERVIEISARKAVVINFKTFNFPGWRAYLDGLQVQIFSESGTQAIMVNVPKGDHLLKLIFEDTPARRWGKWISLVSFIPFSIYLVYSQICKQEDSKLL